MTTGAALAQRDDRLKADDAVIRVRGLTKRCKSAGTDVLALNRVDLDVARAQMLVLLGPSGCGKTTLLRCIGGLESPTEGQVYLGGTLFTSVADGIQRRPEWDLLQSLGCEEMQGYFTARPMTEEGLQAWTAQWNLNQFAPSLAS